MQRHLKIAFFFLSLLLLFVLYYPALTGNFMLDDYSSLPILFTNIDACGFWCGVLSGSTGPTGRPISLISFALQMNYWPEAYWFKVVNLVIHVINTLLLFSIFQYLLKRINPNLPSFYIALFAAFLWAIWPLQISSVLYVIQRMVLLSSFFVLSAILFYLFFRVRLENEWKGQLSKWVLLCVGLAVLGVLAIYSKESGVLLLVYISVIEGLFFNQSINKVRCNTHSNKDIYVRVFRWGCLALPLTVFIIYLLLNYIGNADHYYLIRDYTLEERVLTQGRILIDYLQSLFFPKASSLGLYHDSYVVSESLFRPIATFLSWLFILALIVLGWVVRKKYILLAAGIMWFFVGHILESTVIPLELYFEHRNYLPIAILTLGLVYGVFKLFVNLSSLLIRVIFCLVLTTYTLMMISITFSQARLWGDELKYGVVQAHEHAESVRARSLLVGVYNKLGRVDMAYEEMKKMQKDFPHISGMIVGDVEFACYDSKYSLRPLNEIVPKLEQAKFGFGAIVTITETLREIDSGLCKTVSLEYLYELNKALKNNPLYEHKIDLLLNNEAIIFTMMNKLDDAVRIYGKMNLGPEHWPRYISLLARLGRLNEALEISNQAISILRKQPQYSFYYEDVVRFKDVLEADLNLD